MKEIETVIQEIIDAQNADPFDAEATTDALTDALDLLENFLAVVPTWNQGKAYCGKCGMRLPRKREDRKINYCRYCGRPVKWK